MILAGDVGGTKTHLAVFSPEQGPRVKLIEEKLPSKSFSSLEELVKSFLENIEYPVSAACFGVAGPITEGTASITNLSWTPSETSLAEALNLHSVTLLNDLVAMAAAVPELGKDDLFTLNRGEEVRGGVIGILAPGTGLGEAYLTWDGTRYQANASEGGHTDFAPTSKLEAELLRFLWKKFDHVSYERIASGLGLPNIYQFLKESSYAAPPDWLELELSHVEDKTPVLVNAALGEDPPAICTRTLEIFLSVLGAEAGNLATTLMASGGIYLGGGIPPRILSALESGLFMQSFLAKGRLQSFLAKVPVRVITHPETALLGASIRGIEELEKLS